MSRFHFDEAVMSATASELSNAAQNIASCSVQVQTAVSSIASASGFSIGDIVSDINFEVTKLAGCSDALIEGEKSAEAFVQTIRRYIEVNSVENVVRATDDMFQKIQLDKNPCGTFTESYYPEPYDFTGVLESLKKSVGKVGFGGSEIYAAWSTFKMLKNGEVDDDYNYSVLKNGFGILKALGAHESNIAELKEVTGSTIIQSLFGKKFGEDAAKPLSNEFKGFWKIGSHIVNLVGEFKENTDDYLKGEMSFKRAMAETFGETASSIAVDWAVNTGVKLAATAIMGCTPVGWGAVAVAVGSTIITNTADYYIKKFTGKDMNEIISDFYIDNLGPTVNKVGSAIVNGSKAVIETGKKALQGVADGINSFSRGFRSLLAW